MIESMYEGCVKLPPLCPGSTATILPVRGPADSGGKVTGPPPGDSGTGGGAGVVVVVVVTGPVVEVVVDGAVVAAEAEGVGGGLAVSGRVDDVTALGMVDRDVGADEARADEPNDLVGTLLRAAACSLTPLAPNPPQPTRTRHSTSTSR
jgi:hypothetical protein